MLLGCGAFSIKLGCNMNHTRQLFLNNIHRPQGSCGVKIFTRRQLFHFINQQRLQSFDEKLDFLRNYLLTDDNFSEIQKNEIKHNFSCLKSELKKRWFESHNAEKVFLQKNTQCLDRTFTLPVITARASRPEKSFSEPSEHSDEDHSE